MLEKMSRFFEVRLEGYDEHMMTCIDSASEFYPYTAGLLPKDPGVKVLDLGCGTGLELGYYFDLNPNANITGIDLSSGMLNILKNKYPDKELTLILGSYFDIPLGSNLYDACVSVESLHHFTANEKKELYRSVCESLKDNGYFILTDYFALSDDDENFHRAELLRLKQEQGITDTDFYHYDTPLTVAHEIEALRNGGFSSVEILSNWGATYTLRAVK